MKLRLRIAALAALASMVSAGPALAQASPPTSGSTGAVLSREPVDTQSMQLLRQSADRLRESIQALAGKAPGAERDRAMSEAQQALLRTQQAMLALPPDMRSSGTVASTADYDASVRKLMQSADSLRHSIQEMAQQPAGTRRNDAIREANKALVDTQAAMANAYAGSLDTKTMGNAPSPGAASAK